MGMGEQDGVGRRSIEEALICRTKVCRVSRWMQLRAGDEAEMTCIHRTARCLRGLGLAGAPTGPDRGAGP